MPHVLLLTAPGLDYGSIFLQHGLCQVFGSHNVIEWPLKPSYHGGTFFRDGYKENGGVLTLEQLQSSGSFCWEPVYPIHELYTQALTPDSRLAVVRELLLAGTIDLVVLESARSRVWLSAGLLKKEIEQSGATVVLHDGEDSRGLDHATNQVLIDDAIPHIDMVLLREYPNDQVLKASSGTTVLPYPFSTIYHGSTPKLRLEFLQQYELSLVCGMTCQYRKSVADALHELDAEYKTYVACNPPADQVAHPQNKPFVSWEAYAAISKASNVVVSVRGLGYDTCRRWEIQQWGALLIDAPEIVIPNDYTDGVSCKVYNSPEHAVKCARELLENKEQCLDIYHEGIKHTRKFHTCARRVEYMLAALEAAGHIVGI